MNMSNTGYSWNANDYSNLITISSAAVASVVLVLFKSKCSDISLCWGLWSCTRVVQDESDEDEEQLQQQQPLPPDNP